MSKRRLLRRILRAAGLSLAATMLILGGMFAFLQTDMGQLFLARWLSASLSSPGASVSIQGLGGTFPWSLRVLSIEVADDQGSWLTADNLYLQLKPGELLHGRAHLPLIQLDKLNLHRLPEGHDRAEPSETATLPSLNLPPLDIDHLAVASLVIHEPLARQQLQLSITGSTNLAGPTSTARLTAASLQGPETNLQGRFQLSRDDPGGLLVDVSYFEAPGGLLGTALPQTSQNASLKLDLNGQGPLRDWQGSYSIACGDLVRSRGDLHLDGLDSARLTVDGQMTLEASLLPPWLRQEPGPDGTFRLVLSRAKDGAVLLNSLRLEGGGSKLALQGDVDLTRGVLQAQFSLRTPLAAELLDRAADIDVQGLTRFSGSLKGSFEEPILAVAAPARALRFQDVGIEDAGVEATLHVRPSGPRAGLKVNATIQARQAELPGFTSPLSPVSLDLSGSTADFTTLHLERVVLKERTAMVTARGDLNLDSRNVNARVELRDLALERLSGMAATGLHGGLDLDLDLSGSLDQPLLNLTLEGAVTDLGGVPKEASPMIGDHISLDGGGSLRGSRLQVDSLQVSGLSTLSLNGTVDVASNAFDLEYAIASGDPAPLLASTPVSMDAPPQFHGTLQGTDGDFTLKLVAETPLLAVAGRELHSPALSFELSSLPETGFTGRAGLRADFQGRPLTGSLDLQLPGKELLLNNILLRSGSTELQGSATISTGPYMVQAKARLLAPDLSLWEDLVPLDGPAGSLDAALRARFDRTLQMDMEGEIVGLSLARTSIKQASFELSGENLLADPEFTTTVQAREMRWKHALLPSTRLTLSGTPNRIGFTGSLSALAPMRGSLDLSGQVERRESGTLLTLDNLQGRADRVDFALDGPADIRFAPGSLTIRDLALHTDHGLLNLEGTADEDALDVRAVMEDLDPALFSALAGLPLEGRISGKATLTGEADAPLLQADFSGRDLQVASGRIGQLSPFDMTAALRMTGRQTDIQGTISGFDPEPGSYRLQLPLTWSLFPWTLEMRRNQAISGYLRSALRLDAVSEALALDDQFFDGTASVDITLAGTWSGPELSGGGDLTGGSYENIASGTAISSISGSLSSLRDNTFAVDLSGSGPGGGRVELTGTLGVPPLSPLHYDLRAEVEQARLVQRDRLQSTATGTMRVDGDAQGLSLSGRLTLDPSELRLRSGTPDMVSIPIEEVNVDDRHTSPDQDGSGFVSRLDVALEFPARLSVRGRGLDSEWRGKLSAGGTADRPELRGRLQVVRGTYTFLGERFQLDQGSITFDGASPPNPLVDLTAINRDNGFEARVLLSGQPDNLTVTLESDPALPRDEILARVLFGRSVSELSPLQALKLAQTVGQLTGRDTGPDVLGETREFLGVDELEIGQGAAGGTTLGIGTYIHEDIYIKGEKGLDPEDDAISVEIEITPNIGLETEVGGSGRSGVELFWKKDY